MTDTTSATFALDVLERHMREGTAALDALKAAMRSAPSVTATEAADRALAAEAAERRAAGACSARELAEVRAHCDNNYAALCRAREERDEVRAQRDAARQSLACLEEADARVVVERDALRDRLDKAVRDACELYNAKKKAEREVRALKAERDATRAALKTAEEQLTASRGRTEALGKALAQQRERAARREAHKDGLLDTAISTWCEALETCAKDRDAARAEVERMRAWKPSDAAAREAWSSRYLNVDDWRDVLLAGFHTDFPQPDSTDTKKS